MLDYGAQPKAFVHQFVQWLFVLVPPEHRAAFRMENTRLNAVRGRLTALFLLALSVIILVLSIGGSAPADPLQDAYRIMYWIAIITMPCYLVMFYRATRKAPSRVGVRLIEVTFVLFVLLWNLMITFLDQANYGHITCYVMGVVGAAVIPIMEPIWFLALLLPSHSLFLVLLGRFQANPDVLFGHYINASTFVILAWVVSRMLYTYRWQEYLGHLTITAQNQQLNAANWQLAQLSTLDDLTQTLNRRGLIETAANELFRAIEHKNNFTLMLIDLDHFKQFNDTYGHLAGDQYLKDVANALNNSVAQDKACIGRYGGDEFVVIFSELSEDEVGIRAERIRLHIHAVDFPASSLIHGTVSIGCVTGVPTKDTTLEQVMRQADLALYEAKTARDAVVLCNMGMESNWNGAKVGV